MGNDDILASFHSHPNTGSNFLQEPGATDIRAVRDDLDLKGPDYVGEFVVAERAVFLITPDGLVRELGNPADHLS